MDLRRGDGGCRRAGLIVSVHKCEVENYAPSNSVESGTGGELM